MQKVFYPFLSLSIIAMLITNNGTEFNNIVHSLTAILVTFFSGKIKLFKKNIFEFKLILLTKAII